MLRRALRSVSLGAFSLGMLAGSGGLAALEQARVFTPAVSAAPGHAARFAAALCSRDAAYIADHVAGRLTFTEAEIVSAFQQLPACSSVRYIGGDPSQGSGTRYVFILVERGLNIPYEFSFDEASRCVDVR